MSSLKKNFIDLIDKIDESSICINNANYVELDKVKAIVDQIVKRHYNILFEQITDILHTASNKEENCTTCNEDMVKAVNLAADIITNTKIE